jgi:hypothetical protein
MVDIRRTRSVLETCLADNACGCLSAQDLRDYLISAQLNTENVVTYSSYINTCTNCNIIIQTNGSGAIQVASDGCARGPNAIDLQMCRSCNCQVASGDSSFVIGQSNTANGCFSSAEGKCNISGGKYSHAEGYLTIANGDASHAEGYGNVTWLNSDHAEGCETVACGPASHAEGCKTITCSTASHAEGNLTIARGIASHAEGSSTCACGSNSHAEGNCTFSLGAYSHAEGCCTYSYADTSHAEGNYSYAEGCDSHAEGNCTCAIGSESHAEGLCTITNGNYSHAEGLCTITYGVAAHAEGYVANVTGSLLRTGNAFGGDGSHAEGYVHGGGGGGSASIIADGIGSHAAGYSYGTTGSTNIQTCSNGSYSGGYACGGCITTCNIGSFAHGIAPGQSLVATGCGAFATGSGTQAFGDWSFSEGLGTCVCEGSHAEGCETVAFGSQSHSFGRNSCSYLNFSQAYASKNFACLGDAQHMKAIIMASTTGDVTDCKLTIAEWNGTGYDLCFDTTTTCFETWAFSALVVARRSDSVFFFTGDGLPIGYCESAAWKIEGAIDNNNGTIALVGTPSICQLGNDNDTYWTVCAAANDTCKSLEILASTSCTCDHEVRWVAAIDIVQTTFK